jgi:hypothetical protein
MNYCTRCGLRISECKGLCKRRRRPTAQTVECAVVTMAELSAEAHARLHSDQSSTHPTPAATTAPPLSRG